MNGQSFNGGSFYLYYKPYEIYCYLGAYGFTIVDALDKVNDLKG